jgi:hypothetical protein
MSIKRKTKPAFQREAPGFSGPKSLSIVSWSPTSWIFAYQSLHVVVSSALVPSMSRSKQTNPRLLETFEQMNWETETDKNKNVHKEHKAKRKTL